MNNSEDFDPEMLKNAMMGGFYFSESKTEVKPSPKKNAKKRLLVLDLHFEKLYPELGHTSFKEKLDLQLLELEQFIIDMRKRATRKALVITGQGEGVLIKSVKRFLDKNDVKYDIIFDPPYYGGAFSLKMP